MNALVHVDGKPYFMIGGQTHNSSTTTKETLEQSWRAVERLGMNTIAAPIYWMQIEPEEGSFCFDQIDWIIDGARRARFARGHPLVWHVEERHVALRAVLGQGG